MRKIGAWVDWFEQHQQDSTLGMDGSKVRKSLMRQFFILDWVDWFEQHQQDNISDMTG